MTMTKARALREEQEARERLAAREAEFEAKTIPELEKAVERLDRAWEAWQGWKGNGEPRQEYMWAMEALQEHHLGDLVFFFKSRRRKEKPE